MKKMGKKGFTLAELLIVVAIIAVLVAIAIPVFTAQLEKAREATDQANLRSAYAEAVTGYLSETIADGSKIKLSGVTYTVDITEAEGKDAVIKVTSDGGKSKKFGSGASYNGEFTEAPTTTVTPAPTNP